MPVPGPVHRLLRALDTHLSNAGVTRAPSVLDAARPPMWVEPGDLQGGVPAPGDGTGNERDPATVIGLYYSGGVAGQRWERQATVDFWIRCKGNRPMLRAVDYDERIRDALLGDDELRVNFLLAGGTADELRVIEARVWRELSPLERSAQAYTYIVSYWFQLYRSQP